MNDTAPTAPRSIGRSLLRSVTNVLGRPTILIVLGALYAPLFASVFGSDDVERGERFEGRRFAKKPNFELSERALERFPSRFEAYFNDRIPFRLSLVELNAWIRFEIFGISPNPAILVGQDGWFYDGYGRERVQGSMVRDRDNVSDHTGRLAYTEAELRHWARILEERRVYLAERGIHYVFALAPGKRMVYPEYLPQQLKPLRRESRQEQLARYLAAHSKVAVVDLTESLLAARKRKDAPLLYYKTDEHWNFYGAFVAYRAMIERANREFSGFAGGPLGLDTFDVRTDQGWSHPRFYATLGTEVREPYIRLVPRTNNPLAKLHFSKSSPLKQVETSTIHANDVASIAREGVGGIYEMPERSFRGSDGKPVKYSHVKSPDGAPLDRILLFGDSFIEKCFYYFAANAREVFWHREVIGFPTELIDVAKPQIIFEEIVQRYLLIDLPQNPDPVTQAYLAAAYRKSQRVLFEKELGDDEGNPSRRSRSGRKRYDGLRSIELPPLEPKGPGAMILAVEARDPVRIRLTDRERSEAELATRRVEPNVPAYFELDEHQARRGVSISFDDAKRSRLASIRVRQSDD